MERLRMDLVQDIVYRLRSGQSERAIARDLGHSRITIRRYGRLAREKGYLDALARLPEPHEIELALGLPATAPRHPSTVEPHRSLVEDWLKQGVEMVAMHQRLTERHGYTGSYSSVRRFVGHLRPHQKLAVVRIETPPGQEAQVDFGSAGKLHDPVTGKLRTAYIFVMTLSFSRHQYVEHVFDQTIATWIGCHRRAFESFGGAPRELVIDNLKAAVIQTALEDPVLCAPYRRMAQHYGLVIHPCRVRTPQHKGKVENGVHYVKRNFLAGETFLDIDDANRRVRRWVLETAGSREHGTTKEPPLRRFLDQEKAALLPLPLEPFTLMEVRRARVQRDCHITLYGAYYSVGHAFVGKTVEAHLYENVVQVFDGVNLLFTHQRAQRPGERITHLDHYPKEKAIYLERTPDYCRNQAQTVGSACVQVVDTLLSLRPTDNLRAVQSLIGLIEKVGVGRVEAACSRALFYADPRYTRIKSILAAGLESEPLTGSQCDAISSRPPFLHERRPEEFFGDLRQEVTA